MHGLAILILLMTFLVCAAAIVFWIWTLIDCLTNKRLTDTQKAIWAVVIILVGMIGSLIYFFAGRSPKTYAPPRQYYYSPQPYRQPQTVQASGNNYRPYQEGYRPHDNPRPGLINDAMPIIDEAPPAQQQQQVQYEHIQISYPE